MIILWHSSMKLKMCQKLTDMCTLLLSHSTTHRKIARSFIKGTPLNRTLDPHVACKTHGLPTACRRIVCLLLGTVHGICKTYKERPAAPTQEDQDFNKLAKSSTGAAAAQEELAAAAPATS